MDRINESNVGQLQDQMGGLDITKTTPMICKCGNYTFERVFFLREVSPIVSPTGKAGIVPIPTFSCNACGAVPDKIIPSFIMAEQNPVKVVSETNIPNIPTPATPTLKKGNLELIK